MSEPCTSATLLLLLLLPLLVLLGRGGARSTFRIGGCRRLELEHDGVIVAHSRSHKQALSGMSIPRKLSRWCSDSCNWIKLPSLTKISQPVLLLALTASIGLLLPTSPTMGSGNELFAELCHRVGFRISRCLCGCNHIGLVTSLRVPALSNHSYSLIIRRACIRSFSSRPVVVARLQPCGSPRRCKLYELVAVPDTDRVHGRSYPICPPVLSFKSCNVLQSSSSAIPHDVR